MEDDLDATVRQLVERRAVEDVLLRYASVHRDGQRTTRRSAACCATTSMRATATWRSTAATALLEWIDAMTVELSQPLAGPGSKDNQIVRSSTSRGPGLRKCTDELEMLIGDLAVGRLRSRSWRF